MMLLLIRIGKKCFGNSAGSCEGNLIDMCIYLKIATLVPHAVDTVEGSLPLLKHS